MRDGKLPNMSLDPKPKQEKKPYGTSVVDKYEYNLQLLESKYNAKIQIKGKRHMNKVNQKLYSILINKLLPEMRSKLEDMTGHNQVNADQEGMALLAMIKKIMCGVKDSL